MKYIDIAEFRELGCLQAINREFLHPLGLALEVTVDDETGEERLGRIWDCRDDPEGILYAELDHEKAERFIRLCEERFSLRMASLGYLVQPLEPSTGR